MNWQEVIDATWPQVRRKHLWPELALPQVGEIEASVAMHMRDKQITLNAATCNRLAEHLPAATVVEALLDHGVSHYTRCPWDFATHLHLYATAKAELHRKSLAKLATDAFIDVVANTACVKEVPTPLPDVYRYLDGGALEGTLTALYSRIWGMDLQGSGDPALVRRLARIRYLERQQWVPSLRRFVQLLQPLLEEEGRQRQAPPPALGRHSLASYSSEEVLQGLQAFAQQVPDIQHFREAVEDFAEDLALLGFGRSEAPGQGQGVAVDADVLYYMQLAQTYRLPLRGLPMARSGALEPYSHAPWEASQPVHDIDLWTSFGRLLPGVSQTWVRREGTIFGQREGTPDCLLVLDSSGSMPHPREQLSFAVLGAACAVEAYLRREARMAVYNFSDASMDGKTVVPFTTDRQTIYQGLCVYHGGGTSVRLRDLEALRRTATSPAPDLLVITDMQITNLEEVIDYLIGVEGRITVIHIGENAATERFRHMTQSHPRLHVFSVQDREDIPTIVLGQVQRYFYTQGRGLGIAPGSLGPASVLSPRSAGRS
jgi:hypothetical protein